MLRGLLGAIIVFSLGLLVFPWIGVPYVVLLIVAGIIASRIRGEARLGASLARLDDLVFEGEKLIVSAALVVMTVTVFIDVVWRTARSADLKTSIGFTIVLFGLSLIGGFTRRVEGQSIAKRLVTGLSAFVFIMLAIGLIYLAPNGFGWSQRLALVLIMWVGLLGASMAAKEGRHITVDAVRRIVPDGLKRAHEIAASLVTVAMSFVLTVLAASYVRANWNDWVESEHTSGIFESLPIPYWAATMPIMVGFGLTAARFLGVAFTGAKEVDLLASHGGANLEGAPEGEGGG